MEIHLALFITPPRNRDAPSFSYWLVLPFVASLHLILSHPPHHERLRFILTRSCMLPWIDRLLCGLPTVDDATATASKDMAAQ